MRVADHAEHALVLRHAINRELGVEDFVAAMLAVGLGEHHQLHVGGVATQRGEGGYQIVNLISGQRQTELCIGLHQGFFATAQHVHMVHGRGLQGIEQLLGLGTVQHGTFGHAVVQQGCNALQLCRAQFSLGQQAAFER